MRLQVIDEAIKRIQNGTIGDYQYDPKWSCLEAAREEQLIAARSSPVENSGSSPLGLVSFMQDWRGKGSGNIARGTYW